MRGRLLSLAVFVIVIFCIVNYDCAEALAGQVKIQTDIVYASNDHQGIDPQLNFRHQGLPYDTYKLINRQTLKLDFKQTGKIAIPSGGELKLMPDSYNGSMIKLKVWVEKATKYKLDMVLELANKGTVMVGGPSYQNGVLLIPITASIE